MEEKCKAEKAVEKTGEFIGKGVKKSFGIAKRIGKGMKEEVKEKNKKTRPFCVSLFFLKQ